MAAVDHGLSDSSSKVIKRVQFLWQQPQKLSLVIMYVLET